MSFGVPKFRHSLQQLLDRQKIELLHDHGLWSPSNYVAIQTAARKKVPSIISPRGMLEPWAINYKKGKKQLAWLVYQKQCLQKAKVLHATSVAEAQNLQKLNLHIPIALIPNGVELPSCYRNQFCPSDQRHRTILFLSRIHPVKGLLNFVEALRTVPLTNWRLLIAGPNEDNHQREVEAAITSANLQDKISFTGDIDDQQKWNLYLQADLFVLPSFSENFGIVVAEALASGVPVITTKGTPWQELETYHCGWWVDIGVAPLTQALKAAMNLTDQERSTMGQNGRRLVEQKYSWADVAEKMASVYRWMLGQGNKPDCIWD